MTVVRRDTRIPAFDFTKGALVLLMVLYHWLNYFIGPGHDFYRYLRFLTPSFVFITGFLVSHVYLPKYDLTDTRLVRRLAQRGLKVVGIFTVLNVAISLLVPKSYNANILFDELGLADIIAVYLTGNVLVPGRGKAAAFYVLLPIGYLLLASAFLVVACRFYRYAFHVASLAFLLGILVLHVYGQESANLELVTIGLLGVLCGNVSLETINRFMGHPSMLLVAYAGYLVAITIWNVYYPLQLGGVCLTLVLIHLVAVKTGASGRIARLIIMLGKYSLFAYIAQIIILQLLRRGLRPVEFEAGTFAISFVAAFCLTMVTVAVVDRARARASAIDRLYGAVFS